MATKDAASRRGRPSDRKNGPDRQKLRELVDLGLPTSMANLVARGKMDLNDALSRLAREREVDRLMERHGLTRALATQVSMGHADLDRFLLRRRLERYRKSERDRSFFDDCLPTKTPLALAVLGGERYMGVLEDVRAYEVVMEGDPARVLHKLDIKLMWKQDDWKRVRKVLKRDKSIAERALRPAEKPQDRYSCSDKRFFRYMESDRKVAVTTIEGDHLRGTVAWFGRFEFGLQIRDDVVVGVMRHALYDLSPE